MFRTRSIAFIFSLTLPLTAALVPTLATATAHADAAGDAGRTTTTGVFQRYLLLPNGRPMGLMLADGTFVPTPGRALRRDAPVLTAGTKLDLEGVPVHTATGVLLRGAIVKANGAVLADATRAHAKKPDGEARERHAHHALTPQTASAPIAAIISGARGKVRALVLGDGTTATGKGLEGLGLKVGDRVSVTGKGGVYPLGKALRIEHVTLPNGQTRDLAPPRRPPQGPS